VGARDGIKGSETIIEAGSGMTSDEHTSRLGIGKEKSSTSRNKREK
jgi:hypothetical protein